MDRIQSLHHNQQTASLCNPPGALGKSIHEIMHLSHYHPELMCLEPKSFGRRILPPPSPCPHTHTHTIVRRRASDEFYVWCASHQANRSATRPPISMGRAAPTQRAPKIRMAGVGARSTACTYLIVVSIGGQMKRSVDDCSRTVSPVSFLSVNTMVATLDWRFVLVLMLRCAATYVLRLCVSCLDIRISAQFGGGKRAKQRASDMTYWRAWRHDSASAAKIGVVRTILNII